MSEKHSTSQDTNSTQDSSTTSNVKETAETSFDVEKGPVYVHRAAEQVAAQPYMMEGVTLYTYILEASSPDALQAYVDRCLNKPIERNPSEDGSPYYRVLVNNVLAFLAPIRKTYSLAPHNQAGWVPEIDGGFWVMLGKYPDSEGPFGLPEEVLLFPVAFYVDNVFALVAGREIYGYPKSLGSHEVPKTPFQTEGPFSVSTLLQRKYERDHPFEHGLVWKVDTTDTSDYIAVTERLLEHYQDAKETFDKESYSWTSNDFEDLESFKELYRSLFRGLFVSHPDIARISLNTSEKIHPDKGNEWIFQLSSVFLKQFRDITIPNKACYQSVQQAPYGVTSLTAFGIVMADYDFQYFPAQSLEFREALGLQEEMKVLLATWVRFDMEQRPGLEVWNANNPDSSS